MFQRSNALRMYFAHATCGCCRPSGAFSEAAQNWEWLCRELVFQEDRVSVPTLLERSCNTLMCACFRCTQAAYSHPPTTFNRSGTAQQVSSLGARTSQWSL